MTKKIVLKLKSIKYLGDSIGDTIALEVSILGQNFNEKRRIKVGMRQEFSKIIGEFPTDNKIFEADINLQVTESDPIFNDVGSLKSKIIIDISKPKQEFSYEIKVREMRVLKSKAIAVFSIVLTSEVIDAEKYLSETHDGWLAVKIKGFRKEKSLPSFSRVHFTYSDGKRDYFNILEGFYKGKFGSVAKKPDGLSYLEPDILDRRPIEVLYSLSKKSFILDGEEYAVDDDPNNLFSIGVYDIEIPDAPHDKGKPYLDRSRLALIWFHIGHDSGDDRFLHTGSVSAGCVSMKEIEKWTEACKKLLIGRKDNISVGILRVVP